MPFASEKQRRWMQPAHYKNKTGKAREKAMEEHEESMGKIRSFKPKKKKKGLLQMQGYY